MKVSKILFGLTLALSATAFAGQTGAEILVEKMREPGFEITVGDNSCNIKIFNRGLVDENGESVGSQVEGRMWVDGPYVETVQSPESVDIEDNNTVILSSNFYTKIAIQVDDDGNPVSLYGRGNVMSTSCTINQ